MSSQQRACCICNKRVSSKNGCRVGLKLQKRVENVSEISVDSCQSYVCDKCRRRLSRNGGVAKSTTDPQCMNIPIISIGKTKRVCVICRLQTKHLRTVPKDARLDIFILQGIMVPCGVKCCRSHLQGNNLKSGQHIDASKLRKISSALDCDSVCEILNDIRVRLLSASVKKLDFDIPQSLTPDSYMNLTGLSASQFDNLVAVVISMKTTSLRSVRNAIGLLLTKLRTGLSHGILSTLFGLTEIQVSRALADARKALMTDFVPLHLGFTHISRNYVIEHHTITFAKVLFSDWMDNTAILVMDGTYIYIEKSASYAQQRRCFSIHKVRPLVKPMMITTTDGYILDVIGPFLADAKNNDAGILCKLLTENTDGINDWLKDQDLLILDRGFRDAEENISSHGFRSVMPSFLKPSEKQFTTECANSSRLVTKLRWVVESANGRIKRWKFLSNVISNSQLNYIGDYVKIVCALVNAFRPPLITDCPQDERLAEEMLQRKSTRYRVE